jgi:hypothetical protein
MKIIVQYVVERNLKESGGGREVAQTMYIHVSKCKNDKIKLEKKKKDYCST